MPKTSVEHPVHCVKCGWQGKRKHNLPKSCPKCAGNVVWTIKGKKATDEKEYRVRFCTEYNVTAENEDKAYEEAEQHFREDWESLEFGIGEMFSHDIEEV